MCFSELKSLIKNAFLGATHSREVIVTDNNYAYLSLDWVEKKAYKGYKNWLSIFDFGRGINNSDWKDNFDCEDLSNSFKIYLRLLHAQANPNTFSDKMKGKKNENDSESVLVGTIAFKNSPNSAHSINVFLDEGNQFRFFEPMYGKFIKLTKEQRDSIWYVNF